MNIIIIDHEGNVVCRPDTSRERENMDLFSPDFVAGYFYTPVFFVRICKAGKCIEEKFAGRYYDAVNYGLLLHPLTTDGRRLTVMDKTTVLPVPMYDRITIESGDNLFELRIDGDCAYSTCCGSEAMAAESIIKASELATLRIGDIVALELQAPARLPSLAERAGGIRLSATFCENYLFDFYIK